MTTQKISSCFCVVLLAAVTSICPAQSPPASSSAAGTASEGKATGALTASGRTVTLTYAAAFVDQSDQAKRIVLLLTEKPVPSASWKNYADLMSYHRNTAPIVGVVFRINAENEVDTAEYFVERFPTSTSGIFQVTFDEKPGKTITGTVKASPAAAKLREQVAIDAKFSATVK